MPEGIFTPETPETDEPEVPAEKLEELKGRGLDGLAKKAAHADQFIDFLKEQAKELKAELDRVSAEKQKAEAALVLKDARQVEPVEEDTGADTTAGLSPDAIKSLVSEEIENRTKRGVAESNQLEVDGKVKELYGDRAKEFVEGKAAELGLTMAYLAALAAKSPNAFYNLVGVNAKSAGTPAPTVGTRTAPDTSGSAAPGTKKYYDALRRQDRTKFFSPEVQSKLFKDRVRLGDAFYK